MIIKYGCVILRAVEKKDFDLLFYLINAPEIECKTVGWHYPISEMSQKQWMEEFKCSGQSIKLMIELTNSNTIGMVMLDDIDWKNRTAEFSCKMSAPLEKRIKGDMLDAVNAILKYAFDELGMNCIYAKILEENIFSQKLCRKAGFVDEGILRKRAYKSGRFISLVSLSILRNEFIEREKLQENGS